MRIMTAYSIVDPGVAKFYHCGLKPVCVNIVNGGKDVLSLFKLVRIQVVIMSSTSISRQ